MTKILDERYKQIVDDEILNIFNTLSTSINAKANSSDVYTKLETDEQIRLKVAEIVAGAPEDFDTLKEMSDWLNTHAESAAAMNVQIQDNTTKITKLQSEIQSQSTTIGTHENKISVLTNNVSSLSTGLSAATQNISNAQADIDNNSDDISALKERVAINKTTLGYTKKNLCPVNSKTMSANGWVMGDGGNNVYKVYIPKGKYILTFKQTAIGQSEIQFFNSTNTQITRVLPYASTENSSLKFTITLSEDCYGMKFYNNSGVNTYSNIMIRDAAITDGTYEPYVKSVDERLQTIESTQLIDNPTVTLEYDFTTEIGTVVNNPWSYDITHMFVYVEVRESKDDGTYDEEFYLCNSVMRILDVNPIVIMIPSSVSIDRSQAIALDYDKTTNTIGMCGADANTIDQMKARNHKIQVKITPLAIPPI